MQVLRAAHEEDRLLFRLAQHKPYQDRRESVHVSDLLYCLRKAWYNKARQCWGEEEEDASPGSELNFALGNAVQAWILRSKVGDPESVFLWEGIQCSPDLMDAGNIITNGEELVGVFPTEFKTTRTSSNKPLEKSPHYIQQIMSYMLATGSKTGKLILFHVNGDYKAPEPNLRVYYVVPTSEELAEWGETLKRRAALLREAMQTNVEPPLQEHVTWACKYCPWLKNWCPGGPGDWPS